MKDSNFLFGSPRRYLVNYTAYAGKQSEYEIQGQNCRVFSDRDLAGSEIADEISYHIQEKDGIPVKQVVLHRVA